MCTNLHIDAPKVPVGLLPVETLRPCFPTSIRRALDELAPVLGVTYEQTLRRIDNEKRDYTYCIDCSSASSYYSSARFVSRVSRNSRSSLQFIQPNVGTIPAFDAYSNLRPDDPVAVLYYCIGLSRSTLVAVVKRRWQTIHCSVLVFSREKNTIQYCT